MTADSIVGWSALPNYIYKNQADGQWVSNTWVFILQRTIEWQTWEGIRKKSTNNIKWTISKIKLEIWLGMFDKGLWKVAGEYLRSVSDMAKNPYDNGWQVIMTGGCDRCRGGYSSLPSWFMSFISYGSLNFEKETVSCLPSNAVNISSGDMDVSGSSTALHRIAIGTMLSKLLGITLIQLFLTNSELPKSTKRTAVVLPPSAGWVTTALDRDGDTLHMNRWHS